MTCPFPVIHNMLNCVENYLDDVVFWCYSYPQQSKKPTGYQPMSFFIRTELRDELPTRSRRNLEPIAVGSQRIAQFRSISAIVGFLVVIVKMKSVN